MPGASARFSEPDMPRCSSRPPSGEGSSAGPASAIGIHRYLPRRCSRPMRRPISCCAGTPSGQRSGLPMRTPRTWACTSRSARLARVTSTSGSSGMGNYGRHLESDQFPGVSMTGFAARFSGPRPALFKAVALAAALVCGAPLAQPSSPTAAPLASTAAATPAPANSSLDALLFYQLLIGELGLKAARAGTAFEVILHAAKPQSDETLFQRAVKIALQARAGEQALTAATAWRNAKPQAVAPLRYQTQILLALNRAEDAAGPLAAWIAAAPTMERPGLIASLPRLLQRLPDQQRALVLSGKLLTPYLDDPGTRTAARVALGRAHLAAGLPVQALGLH